MFGTNNFLNMIVFEKTTGDTSLFLNQTGDYLLWYGKDREKAKYRQLLQLKTVGGSGATQYNLIENEAGERRPATRDEITNPKGVRFFSHDNMTSQRPPGSFKAYPVDSGSSICSGDGVVGWRALLRGLSRLTMSQ